MAPSLEQCQKDPGALRQWALNRWVDSFQQAAEAMTGSAVTLAEPAPEAIPANEDRSQWLVWRQPFDFAPGAGLRIWASETAWASVGRAVLSAAGIDEAARDDLKTTFQEILQQSLSGLASGLSALFGREVNTAPGELLAPDAGNPRNWFEVAVPGAAPDSGTTLLGVAFDDEFRLQPSHGQPEPPSTTGANSPAPAGSPTAAPGDPSAFELLYDVELPVAISFGRAHLPLRDVLRLTSGSIVELNRTVAEPVELIVNNCVVARAEVVVVDGNYGVRIIEIINHKERLRTLH